MEGKSSEQKKQQKRCRRDGAEGKAEEVQEKIFFKMINYNSSTIDEKLNL